MKVPVSWLREYVETTASARDMARRLSISAARGRARHRRRRPGRERQPRPLRRRPSDRGRSRTRTPTGSSSARSTSGNAEPQQIVCGAWNFGVGATVAVGLPGALLPGLPGPLEERPLRGEISRGMILAEDEIGLGPDHSGIMLLPDGLEPGTPLSDVLPLVDQVLDVTPTMNRPDLLSMVGVAREVAALLRRRPPPPRPGGPAHDGRGTGRRRRQGLRRLPAVHRARLPRRAGRPVAAVAAHAPPSRRHAVDLERRRRDELRDARLGEPAPRVRPGEARGRPDRRPPRARGGEAPDARRHPAAASPERPPDHGRRACGRAGGDHGWTRLGGLRGDDRAAARGGELRADRHPPDVRAARAAHRGVEQVGEGRRPVRGRACGRAREPASRRPRRSGAHRLGGRERRPARAARRVAAARAGERPHRPRRACRGAAVDPRAARLRRRRRMARDGADASGARRHARDRRRRGGREGRARPRADDDAPAPFGRRPPDARAALPPRARGRARRGGLLRGLHVEPDPRRPRSGRAPPPGPDERRARGAAHDAAPRPGRGGAGQRRLGQRRHPAVRAREGLPPVRRAASGRAVARRRDRGGRLRGRARRRSRRCTRRSTFPS